ncbi:MAG TPA: hydroxymethylbilane synthase [Gemmatimonadales bacterium]|nr:hydroxymethylbilane synthase [Gemmatimonadales bacterium]
MSRRAPGVPVLRIGTRGSMLALTQARLIGARLAAQRRAVPEEVIIASDGDRDTDTPLQALANPGVFTSALERGLLDGTIDVAVHSLKDLPVEPTPGLALAAVGFREDPRDALLSESRHSIASLPPGARVGSCSVRRTAQLLALRPDLRMLPLRGNIDTRIGQLLAGRFDAIVLAMAGLARLGLGAGLVHPLPLAQLLPAPGQGALAIQCRLDDSATRAAVEPLDNCECRAATIAERAFLEGLGGGCLAPVAASATVTGGELMLLGAVFSTDGQQAVRVRELGSVRQARDIGLHAAHGALARGAVGGLG